MNKNHIIISAIMGAIGIALGAFGAHGLRSILSPEMLETYKTGVFYHITHTVVLLALSLNTKYNFSFPFYFIFSGIVLFSFSLYAYTLTGITSLAMITPFGGVSLIIGWLAIIYKVYKNS